MKRKLTKIAASAGLFLIVYGFLLLLPLNFAWAADALQFTPQIPVPGMGSGSIAVGSEVNGVMTSDLLGRYIQAFYDYGLKVGGILAAVILMGGGVIWLTSGGNQTKIGQAKEMIIGSISGLVILFSAWLILNTVNPALLKLTPISLKKLTVASDQITDLSNAPSDMIYGWVCMNSEFQRCEDANPPSLNLSLDLCRTGNPENAEPSEAECSFTKKRCCGKSASVTQTANNFCQGKTVYTPCNLNSTSVTAGYCYNNECTNKTVCCQCGQGEVGGVYLYVTCKNDVPIAECKNWCINGWVGSAWIAYPGGSDSYSCAGGAMSYCRQQ